MKHVLRILALSIPLLFTLPAMAILEVNVGGQGLLSSSGGGNWTGVGSTNYSISGGYGLQADVRLNIPLSDWQFGVRYGQIGLTGSNSGYNLAMNATTYSGLIGYRIINTLMLFGPVITYGTGSGTLQNSASSYSGTATASSVSQYTAGLEIGIKYPILISAELGIGNLSMSSFSNNQTLNGSATNVSLSGTYARASVGFTF